MLNAQNNTLLERGRFYQVIVRGGGLTGARSADGLLLTGLNHPNGYSWTFRVKNTDDATCGVAAVDVTPMKKIETVEETMDRLIEETERLLRNSRYLYEVKVRAVAYHEGVVDIEVQTLDTWTLDPGLSVGRSGGASSSMVGRDGLAAAARSS